MSPASPSFNPPSFRVWLLAGAPLALLSLWLVAHFGVEVPYWDEWDTPGNFFERRLEGIGNWRDWFFQHGDSRKAVPRLLFLAQALTTGWTVKPWMYLSWAIAAGIFLLLRREVAGPRWQQAAFGLAAAALLFSPAQAENQLWGIQFIVWVPPLAIVLGLRVPELVADLRGQCALCASLALVATFTFANGLLVWLLICPLWPRLVARNVDRQTLASFAAYAVAGSATIWWYFQGLVRPDGHPEALSALGAPRELAAFFVAWLGAPLTYRRELLAPLGASQALGVILALAAVMVLGTSLFRLSRLSRAERLWLTLLAYALISGMLTSLGRLGFGIENATPSRYVTFALWGTLGVLGFLLQRAPAVARPVLGAVLALALPVWVGGVGLMQKHRDQREQDRLTLDLLEFAPESPGFARMHPDPAKLVRRARLFRRVHWMRTPAVESWLPEALISPPPADAGWFSWETRPGDRTRFSGWAMRPATKTPADFVVVVARSPAGVARVLAAVRPSVARPDVAKELRSDDLLLSGFAAEIPTPRMDGEEKIEALAVDAAGRRVFPLRRHE